MTNSALIKAIQSGAIVLDGLGNFSGTQLIVLEGKVIGYLHDKAVVDGCIIEELNGVIHIIKI